MEMGLIFALTGLFVVGGVAIWRQRAENLLSRRRVQQLYRIHKALESRLNVIDANVPRKQLHQVEAELAEMRELHDRLLDSHKKLRSRKGMERLRADRANGQDDDIRTADWKANPELKARARMLLHQGKLK